MTPSNDPSPQGWAEGLQPMPETLEAVDELGPDNDSEDLLSDLLDQGRRVRELVPDCVGLSLATIAHGVTLTLVASDRDIAMLDALQYLDTGPCVDAAAVGRVVSFEADEAGPDWESPWRFFAEASAAAGVRSTLSLPILTEDAVVGSVNLYAASARAFEGLHDDVAAIFHAWAPGAVSNADLSSTTREHARRAPRILRESARVDAAIGLLVVTLQLEEHEARRRLQDAADRGGLDEVQLARALLSLLGRPGGPQPA